MAETVHPTPEDGSLDPGEGIEGESIQQGTPVTPEPGNSGTGLGEDANGNPTEPYPGAVERPASWSEVDPAYQELLTDAEAEAQEDTDDDLIDEPAPDVDPEEAAKLQGPVWAAYELWSRNVDEGGAWQQVATEKFDGELEAEVGDLDTDSTHEYKVRLVDADGRRSKYSEVIQVTTPSDFTPPPEPPAPSVSQLMAAISLGWDGTLLAEMPEDFSHANLRIRQLHPVGDPTGAPGDSQLVTRFSEKGAWTTASLPQAAHEAWLTAVDTTGNESPASATVEFTPEKPVDVADIEQRINEFADGDLEDAAYDNLMARLGEFLVVKAGQIDANDIVTNSLLVAELEAHGITLTESANGRTFEISGTGWKLTDTSTGEVLASLGVDGELLARGATIEGGTVTGSTFETSPDWASAGGATMRSDGTYGNFVAAASDGTIMARLGGDENTLTGVDVQGRFQTSYDSGSGLTIDYGAIQYYSLQAGAMRSTTAPYIRLADGSGGEDDQPAITVRDGEMIVAPGRDSGGNDRPVSLDARVLMRSANVSADLTAGEFRSRDYPFNAALTAGGLSFWSDDNPRTFGFSRLGGNGYRLGIQGELKAGQGQDDMMIRGSLGFYSLDGGQTTRGSVTYGTPARSGSRHPHVTATVTSFGSGYDGYKTVSVVGQGASASGFSWVADANGTPSGTVSFRILFLSIWGGE